MGFFLLTLFSYLIPESMAKAEVVFESDGMWSSRRSEKVWQKDGMS